MSSKNSFVTKYNPHFNTVDFESSLSIGNGDFAYNCDITGFQTLFDEYLNKSNPLSTMSNFDWDYYSSSSKDGKIPQLSDLTMDQYELESGKIVKYPANANPQLHYSNGKKVDLLSASHQKLANEELYNYLRLSPHRVNLGLILLEVNGRIPNSTEIQNINTYLDISKSKVYANYTVDGYEFSVITSVYQNEQKVVFDIKSNAFKNNDAKLIYHKAPSSHTISGFNCDDAVDYYFDIKTSCKIAVRFDNNYQNFDISKNYEILLHNDITENSYIKDFWDNVEVVKLDDGSKEMQELERREILSLYNLAIHSSGSLPPQETGLMCNSWYGKFHLEMHLWHSAWAPLYGVSSLLEKSLKWYLDHQSQARQNAKSNDYKGLRWPKMVGPDAIDSPSFIAPLLIWQQSHIVFLLELLYHQDLPDQYSDLVKGTIDFMCDFLVYDSHKDCYDIVGPIQCAQEEFEPMSIKNPTFELAYWKYCIGLALKWFDVPLWNDVYQKISIPMPVNNLYPSHQNAPDTFPNFMKDHPMQLAILGMFDNKDVDNDALQNTLDKVLKSWDEQSMWGWDYGYMAMLADSLDNRQLAKDILLKKCPKNYYAVNGHNYQLGRTDLPSYLPGNGALVWAIKKIWG